MFSHSRYDGVGLLLMLNILKEADNIRVIKILYSFTEDPSLQGVTFLSNSGVFVKIREAKLYPFP